MVAVSTPGTATQVVIPKEWIEANELAPGAPCMLIWSSSGKLLLTGAIIEPTGWHRKLLIPLSGSFTVAIPADWLVAQKLVAGDMIDIAWNDLLIEIYPTPDEGGTDDDGE